MFFGREDELKMLDGLWAKDVSSMVVCRGRRRVGKSTLIAEFARRSKCRFIEISGLAPDPKMTNARQLAAFCERLAMVTGMPEVKVDSWQKAFGLLALAVKGRGKTVVLLDEISWMGKYDPTFAAELKNAWDVMFSRRKDLILFICGSVSAWIQQNILNSTGFVGRVSLEFVLGELKLCDCVKFWGRRAEHLGAGEFFDVLSVTGGVPKYLQELNPSESAEANIRRLCFTPSGFLFRDFESIFNDIFEESFSVKHEVMVALRDGPRNLTEIAERLDSSRNGHLTAHLDELEKAGFVASDIGVNPATGELAQERRYRICDNYSRFYLRYVEPNRESVEKGVYTHVPLAELPEWNAIMGLQFENLMLGRVTDFYDRLGLDRARVLSVAPYRRAASKRNGPGLQVDLLIQTPRTAYVIEIKRKRTIGREVEDEVERKVERLRIRKGVSIRTALVYQGELDPRISEDGYFSALISADSLLKPRS